MDDLGIDQSHVLQISPAVNLGKKELEKKKEVKKVVPLFLAVSRFDRLTGCRFEIIAWNE